MTDYEVRYTRRARNDIAAIVETEGRWALSLRRAYADEGARQCLNAGAFPRAYPIALHLDVAREIRNFTYKAHRIFFVVDDDARLVMILRVLPGRMDHRRLFSGAKN